MNFMNWNIRDLNSTRKRQILVDIIKFHKIDMIQETKANNFLIEFLELFLTILISENGCFL